MDEKVMALEAQVFALQEVVKALIALQPKGDRQVGEALKQAHDKVRRKAGSTAEEKARGDALAELGLQYLP